MKIETIRNSESKSSNPLGSIQVSIPKDMLFAYQQAAQEFDFILNVAKKGEVFGTSDTGTGLVSKEGNIGINYMAKKLTNSDGSVYDYSSFGNRVEELFAQSQTQPQIV